MSWVRTRWMSLAWGEYHGAYKARTHALNRSSSTSHLPPDYSPVYNPSGPAGNTEKRSPGGSSGGSAAAVADGSCDV